MSIRLFLVALLGVIFGAGCAATPFSAVSRSKGIPIVELPDEPNDPRFAFDQKAGYAGDYEFIGRSGGTVTISGMLYNGRSFEEQPQEQFLLPCPIGFPFSPYWLRLKQPLLALPPCSVEWWDYPDKKLAGAYRIQGRLETRTIEEREVYELVPMSIEEVKHRKGMQLLCKTSTQREWAKISQHKPKGLSRYGRASPMRLGDFVRRIEPRLLCASFEGRQHLFLCAAGRVGAAGDIETIARVYCLISLRRSKVLRFYIESSSHALE